MTSEDLKIAHAWRNDELVRRMAVREDEISWEEFEAVFKYSNHEFYIFEINYTPIGYVEIAPSESKVTGTWSFHIAPEKRGLGLSVIMLRMALYKMRDCGYDKVRAEVKTHNEVSIKLHEQLGFNYVNGDRDLIEMEKSFALSL